VSEHTAVLIRDNPAASRYEVDVDGRLAIVQYMLTGQNITFTHTEVPVELEGRGIASQMARFALDDARARGLRVIPVCPFISAYIRRHPEYQDLVFWNK
jgi:predicted GNAT family acetyltransferase